MKGDTPAALFSPALWTGGGMLSAEGDKKGVTWDRSLLYVFKAIAGVSPQTYMVGLLGRRR